MKVLVTGATGFLGSWIARELAERGHAVRALVRKTSSLANLEGLNVERAEGDVLDAAAVKRALEGVEGVVHTAGVASFMNRDRERMYEVNVRGVEVVLGAAKEAGVKRAVLTSSTAVMGGTKTPRIADESTPSNAEALGIDYFISKYRGEQVGLRLAAEGLPLVIMRPVVALGPGDIYRSSATTFLALAREKLPVVVEGGASFTDARDIAKAHAEAFERGKAGEIYILGGHNLPILEMVERVAKFAGVKPPKKAPFPLAYAVATAADFAQKLGVDSDLSKQLLLSSSLYTFVTSAKAERELGYEIRPFEEMLADTLRFFIQQGRLTPSTAELKRLVG